MNARSTRGWRRRYARRFLACILFGSFAIVPAPSRAQDGAFPSGSLQLHYRTKGSGRPVVILSGGPGFEVDYMLPVADAFPGYRAILLEQRGTGRSRPAKLGAEDMTLRVAVQDLDALREYLQEPRLFLVGHSWGGMLAMAYAAAHPDRIDRLILIGSGGPTLEFASWFRDNIRARLRREDVEAQRYWEEAGKHGVAADKAALESARAIVPGYFFDRGKGLAFAAQLPDGALHSDVNTMLFEDLGKHYDLRDGLRAIDRPTLLIYGHQDPIGDKTAEDIHSLITSSTLIYVDKCGHFPWIEQPEAFRRALDGFLTPSATSKQE